MAPLPQSELTGLHIEAARIKEVIAKYPEIINSLEPGAAYTTAELTKKLGLFPDENNLLDLIIKSAPPVPGGLKLVKDNGSYVIKRTKAPAPGIKNKTEVEQEQMSDMENLKKLHELYPTGFPPFKNEVLTTIGLNKEQAMAFYRRAIKKNFLKKVGYKNILSFTLAFTSALRD